MSSQPVLASIPNDGEDMPVPGLPLAILDGLLSLPEIVFGAGSFSNQYNTNDHLTSSIPLRTVRLALRYGIRAFDTSVYYGPSEVVLGNALDALKEEFPRSSYTLMTKCGRYGPSTFDYSPARIRESVKNSLTRLKSTYLDSVYLHDVEYVCTPTAPQKTGNHTSALHEDAAAYGLAEGHEATIRGEGDQKILDAYATLRQLQDEGLIKHIGITGYPLPTLLRLAILIFHHPPFKPVDVILSYSHLSLQNSTFLEFVPHFYKRAQLKQLLAASPLSMGLLTYSPPAWHPASEELLIAAREAGKIWPEQLPNLALGYSIRHTGRKAKTPLIVGFSSPREVHECIRVLREVREGVKSDERLNGEEQARSIFEQAGVLNWSWASP